MTQLPLMPITAAAGSGPHQRDRAITEDAGDVGYRSRQPVNRILEDPMMARAWRGTAITSSSRSSLDWPKDRPYAKQTAPSHGGFDWLPIFNKRPILKWMAG